MPDAVTSVIIPTFNRAHTLPRAIASALAQTRGDFELIVVDDASSDDTRHRLSAVDDRRLRVVTHPVNRGAAAARNTGIRESRGTFIAFLDSDDEWLPQKLAMQYEMMEGDRRFDATCTAFYLDRDGHRVVRRPQARAGWAEELLDGCYVSPGSTLMARRECFALLGLFDETLARFEDWEWLLRLVDQKAFACLDEPLAVVHAGRSPSAADVATAGRRLYDLAAAHVAQRFGAAGQRRLRASLAIETAVAAAREGKVAQATAGMLRAGALAPARLLTLAGRTAGKLRQRDW